MVCADSQPTYGTPVGLVKFDGEARRVLRATVLQLLHRQYLSRGPAICKGGAEGPRLCRRGVAPLVEELFLSHL